MARNFNTHNGANTRVISSWLHEIPTDAGGDSEATLIEPSVYEQSSPRRRKEQPRKAQPRSAKPPPPTPQKLPLRPPAPAPSPASVRTDDAPRPTPSPTRPPARPQASPAPGPGPTPNPSPITTPKKGLDHITNNPLRQKIITNFRSHCLICHPPGSGGGTPNPTTTTSPERLLQTATPPPPPPLLTPTTTTNPTNPVNNNNNNMPPCPRCAAARSYTLRPHHHQKFLACHLLPISEVLSFDETVAYLNEALVARLAGVLERGKGYGYGDRLTKGVARPFPTLDDFDVVRGLAERRRKVLAGFEGLGVDSFGLVRDRPIL